LLGLAVGDALGAPLEGAPPARAAAAVASGLEMVGGHGWEAGEWTDDTAMALALAESIGERGLLDLEDVARRYIAWAATRPKGMGRATRRALVGAADAAQAQERARALLEQGLPAAGNGTVMRATPIALAARSREEAARAARRDASLTHGDPRAGDASACLCAALLALAAGEDPLPAALAEAGEDGPLGRSIELAAGGGAELARLAAGRERGACWTTLAVALHALLHAGSFEQGLRWVISLGGDTDTNAAVAGSLLGLHHGPEAIPARWLERLRGRARIEAAAAGLLRRRGGGDSPDGRSG
jgi:ADP-ribosyl-[dinitrogen reductase] hydrolase